MKFIKTYLFFLALLISAGVNSQNTKHSVTSAKIVYRVTLITEKGVNNKPLDYTLYLKKDMSRVEMESEKGKMVMISDNLGKSGYTLMDNSGQKIAMKMNMSKMMAKNGNLSEPKVVITRESKVIAGYTCYKAIVTSQTKEGERVYDVWFTNDIKGNYSYETNINGLNGLMMEFESERDGKTYKMVAVNVEPDDSISDELFKVPSDYQIIDMSNFQGGRKR